MRKFVWLSMLFAFLAVLVAWLVHHLLVWLVVSLYLTLVTYGVANIRSGFFLAAFCRGKTGSKKVVLTFDDGPDPEKTPAVLQILREWGVKASFFCMGHKLKRFPAVARQILEEGHILGNHSYSHSWFFPLKSRAAIRKEILDTRSILETLTGKPDFFFRPPFGVTNPTLHYALQGLGYKVIGWSIRSFDLSGKPGEITVNRIIRKLRGGEVILLHDTSAQAVQVLQFLLEQLKQNHWEVIPLTEMIREQHTGEKPRV